MTLLFKVRMSFCNEFVDSNAIGYIRRLAGIFITKGSVVLFSQYLNCEAGASAKRE